MKFYLRENVWDAALNRIRWLFDEFDNVVVSTSGGKDSTVITQLALIVAAEKKRLPQPVFFLDQEAEWQSVIDYIRGIMHDERVLMQWFQGPFRMSNSTSPLDPWLYAWREGDQWIRPKEPDSIHVNELGVDRFHEMFGGYLQWKYPRQKVCYLAGVRAEESPTRLNAMTQQATYKTETWGKRFSKQREHYTFYPIYDWSYTDVWKAIHDNHWPYCALYDRMYQYGVALRNMRVSNVHHETSMNALYYLQEIEPETWNRITSRLSGINTVGHLQADHMKPRQLPFMFKDWREYRDHLLENLVTDSEIRERFRITFAAYEGRYLDPQVLDELYRVQCSCILVNDYEGVKIGQFRITHPGANTTAGSRGGFREPTIRRRTVEVIRD